MKELTALGAKRLTSKLMTGLPWATIVSALEDTAFDLVLVGTRGRTGLSRVLLGSVAEKIGYPGAQTLAVLDDEPALDLVVVGTHGRTGLAGVFLGSVAEKIVRNARCPVLVARQRV